MYTIINKYVTYNKSVTIWNYCNIVGTKKNPTTIGDNSQIGSYTEIGYGVTIGKWCKIQAFVFICGMTTIGNTVFIGPRVTFLNDKHPFAEDHSNHSWIISPCKVENNAVIGGGSIIGPGITIGRSAIVGMGSVVTKNVFKHEIVAGNPARVIGFRNKGRYKNKFSISKD